MSVIPELRRRQVFRAVAWYGGLAWLAIEVADTVFPQFGLPEWLVRAVIVAALLGLPVAIALAWSFDLSRLGLRRELPPARDVPDQSAVAAAAPTAPLWRIPSFWIALALGAGLAVSAQQAWLKLVRPAFGERPGIAVLPFANLSPDPANAYFANGLHEEILATLARVSGLRVISRTSVVKYRDSDLGLREIAEALDVSLILEGSVRREGDDLRLTLQLIDGRTDEHLWAETYDRKFENALHLQRTVAQQIVAAIGAQLTPTEDRLIERSAPADLEAYEFYLHSLTRWNQYASEEELEVLLGFLDRTIELDPDFALAYALRAKARVWLGGGHIAPEERSLVESARADIDRALALEPALPEALAARGLYHTYVSRDPERGLEDLLRALAIAPNDPDTHNVAGLTLRRLGRFDQAVEHFRMSARLAPREPRFGYRAQETLFNLGRIDEAEQERLVLIQRFPELPYSYVHEYTYRFVRTGRTDGWREEFERRASHFGPEYRDWHTRILLKAEGDIEGLIEYLEQTPPEAMSDPGDREFELGSAYSAIGDSISAQPYLESVAAAVPRASGDALALAAAAVALKLLGRRTEALRAADEAARLMSEVRDEVNTPKIALLRAWVLIRSGTRAEEGYVELERWLGSYAAQPRLVAVEPLWRILGDDPRTQEIFSRRLPSQ